MNNLDTMSSTQTKLSVAICTHNPRPDLIARALAALRSQTLSVDHWELLIIDNMSKTPLQQLVDVSWHPNGRIIQESTLGLTPARLCAIAESKSPSMVFVDDDNILDA